MTYEEMTKKIEKKLKKSEEDAKEIVIRKHISLEKLYKILKEADDNSENVYINRLGVRTYSKDITLDKVYRINTGYTKENYLEKCKREDEDLRQWLRDSEKRVEEGKQSLIKEGNKLIKKSKRDSWKKEVEECYKNHKLSNIEKILEIMRALDKDDVEKALEIFRKQRNNPAIYRRIKNAVSYFSKNGKEFARIAN